MPATFTEVWRRVRLYAPDAPALLVRDWIQGAYNDLCGRRHWGWLRKDGLITTKASRSLTLTVTEGSSTVTSLGLFVASDAGRQIRLSTASPIYTISTVDDVSTVTLTEFYRGTSGAILATIQDIYLVMPEDFRSFLEVTNFAIQRPVAWWISRELLDAVDPSRIQGDAYFRALVAATYSQAAATEGRVTYEAWPFPSAATTYGMTYFSRADTIAEDSPLPGLLATRTDILVEGGLARCARWPGLPDKKNPYFNLPLALQHDLRFDRFCLQLDVMDDDQYLMSLDQVDLAQWGLGQLSADTSYLRASDATTGDYFGGI